MKITVFAKKRTTADGKKFYNFLSRLVKKDGSDIVVSVKFPEEDTPKVDECPLNIEFDKHDANLDIKTITKEDGTTVESRTLWVKSFTRSKDKYVDTSLDDFVE